MATLASVVTVDENKCVNCHACIAVCPVKFCNDGSGDFIAVDHDLCIGCGSCITACTHQARLPVDDAPRFFADVGSRPFVAIAAPAVAASFPGQFLRLNGWLAELGVEAVFDVSFGAELTVKSYLEHIRKDHPKAVIAQPCPAVVTYIQLHRPELLPYLAPADSPMAHTIKMVREFFPEFRSHRVLVLSPCVAKRREFDALGWGDEVYNVTYRSIQDHLAAHSIPLSDYPEVAFHPPAAERAVTFSTPGGLLHTVTREVPEAPGFTRKIEGPRVIYPYLDGLYASIERGENPLLVDGLNCEWGCNGGTGTNNEHRSPDAIEALVRRRDQDSRKAYRSPKALGKVIDRFWKEGLYGRTYTNLVDQGLLKEPDEAQLKDVYARMAKHDQGDIYNCNSCGYGECRKMAVAVFNGLNKPENCHHYNLDLVRVENEKALAEEAKLTKVIEDNAEVTRAIEAIVTRMAEDGLVIAERTARLTGLSEEGQGRNREITAKLEEIALSLQGLDGIVKTILDLARRSNLLSLNATIEASRAGKSGAAFAVVADEVKRMAGQTQLEAKKIEPFAQELKGLMGLFAQEVGRSVEAFQDQVGLIHDLSTVASRLKTISGELEEKSRLLSGGRSAPGPT